jgi:hypothetical protein
MMIKHANFEAMETHQGVEHGPEEQEGEEVVEDVGEQERVPRKRDILAHAPTHFDEQPH